MSGVDILGTEGRPRWWGPLCEGAPSDDDLRLVAQIEAHLGESAGSVMADLRECAPMERYLVLKQLGSSKGAKVYQAIDRVLARTVVLKLHLDARGLAEARAIAQAKHPHVIEVYEVGHHEGHDYTVLEWCEGADLGSWAEGRPWREVLRKVLEAGEGLEHCHALGIIHGDVKPANILVIEGRAVLADFGLAGGPGYSLDTAGTRGFMAPEVGEGLRHEGIDVYALACTAWACLFGELPYEGATLIGIWERAFQGSPDQPEHVPPGMPGEAIDAVAMGLHPDSRRRPSLRRWTRDVAQASAQAPLGRRLRPLVNAAAVLLAGVVLGSAAHSPGAWCLVEDVPEHPGKVADTPASAEPLTLATALAHAQGGDPLEAWEVYAEVRATQARDMAATLELARAMFDAAKHIDDTEERGTAITRARWVAQDVHAVAETNAQFQLRDEAWQLMLELDKALTPDSQPFRPP